MVSVNKYIHPSRHVQYDMYMQYVDGVYTVS